MPLAPTLHAACSDFGRRLLFTCRLLRLRDLLFARRLLLLLAPLAPFAPVAPTLLAACSYFTRRLPLPLCYFARVARRFSRRTPVGPTLHAACAGNGRLLLLCTPFASTLHAFCGGNCRLLLLCTPLAPTLQHAACGCLTRRLRHLRHLRLPYTALAPIAPLSLFSHLRFEMRGVR